MLFGPFGQQLIAAIVWAIGRVLWKEVEEKMEEKDKKPFGPPAPSEVSSG